MPSEVRLATPADAELNGLAPIDEPMVRAALDRGISRDRAVIGVIRGAGVIEASVGLYIGNWWYSQNQHCEDLWNFVSEPYRKSEHAKALLQWAKHAASFLEKPLLMGVLSNERTQAKIRLYERQLGPQIGALFVVRTPAAA
jgi:ABC-type transport system substrate-binding protein